MAAPVSDEAAGGKVRAILQGVAATSVAYGLASRLVGGGAATAEDVVDLLHSSYVTAVALRGIRALRRHPIFLVVLPPHLSDGAGPVVRMYCHSAGFFLADTCFILFELMRQRRPKLWAGRLVHHAIQSFCNLVSVFRRGASTETQALRSGLCLAYLAELSSIFLRVGNMARHAQLGVRRAVSWTLLLSFAVSRLGNFAFLIRCWVRARCVLSPALFHTFLGVHTAGYLLNLGWFVKIARGTLRLQRPRALGA